MLRYIVWCGRLVPEFLVFIMCPLCLIIGVGQAGRQAHS